MKIDRFTLQKKLWTLPLYGLIQVACILVALLYQRYMLNKRVRWTVKNELSFLLLVIAITWSVNYFFYIFFVTSGENTYSFIDHAKYHYFPGLLMILPVLVISRYISGYIQSSKNYAQRDLVLIKGTGNSDTLRINRDQLLFIRSQDNYADIHYLEREKILRKVIRAKLNDLLIAHPFLVQTHRSYLVNPIQVKEHINSSKKLMLKLPGDYQVPVSRSKKSEILTVLSI
ncbi:MAG: LytTR family DNA-binding domain-containing protein [Bacteroidota bacterium]